GTIGVLVELSGVAPDDGKARGVAHDIAMHIASEAPRWVRREEVPAELVEAERRVLENLTRNEGKPEAAISKIVEGRLGGFYKSNVLLEQPFVKDPKVILGSLVSSLGPDATVRGFVRLRVGEE
ncbi:MAG: translation elongation factor Ts, partial [Acidimicrobiia bacterium]